MQQNFEIISDRVCQLGEGPVWDADTESTWWVDILGGEIHRYFQRTNEHKVFYAGPMISAIALREHGGMVASLQNGFAFIDVEKQRAEAIPGTAIIDEALRFNDGKCDPAGRFWAGTMALSGEPGAGSLYTLETDRSVSLKLTGVSCSNGLAWSPDHKTLYFIDTPTSQVVAFDYNISDGSIANKKTVITIPENEGYPDGMTIDKDGMLWIASWNGWHVGRWDPNTGKLLHRINLPVSKITSCIFGGKKLNDLYITSARVGFNAYELEQQPLAGSLFIIKSCGYTGMEAFKFKG
jgi:sugar lactone lactonase YvrE